MAYKTLILGGTGFIGHHIARELLAKGHTVRVLARAGGDRSLLKGMDVEIVDGDLSDSSSLLAALEGCDALIHAAAHYPVWSLDADREAELGRQQILRVHEALAKHPVERFVYVSGPAAVGRYPDGRPADEDAPWPEERRKSAYARVKREMQDLVLYNARRTNATVVVPTGTFGPGDRKPTTGQLIVDIAANRVPVALHGRTNAVSVFAVADGVRRTLEQGAVGRLYVLGDENLTVLELCTRIADIVGVRAPRLGLSPDILRPVAVIGEHLARRMRKDRPAVPVVGLDFALFGTHLSSDVARNELGYDPSAYPLDAALKDAWEWFKDQEMV